MLDVSLRRQHVIRLKNTLISRFPPSLFFCPLPPINLCCSFSVPFLHLLNQSLATGRRCFRLPTQHSLPLLPWHRALILERSWWMSNFFMYLRTRVTPPQPLINLICVRQSMLALACETQDGFSFRSRKFLAIASSSILFLSSLYFPLLQVLSREHWYRWVSPPYLSFCPSLSFSWCIPGDFLNWLFN